MQSGALTSNMQQPMLGAQAPSATGALGAQPQGVSPGGSSAGSMPGQQLGYGNMVYNANNSNQQGMNTLANNQGFNQNQFNQIYNPYVSDVANNMAALQQRQFQQQQLPALQSAFGSSGQPGSARGMATIEQANNQNAQNIANTQSQLLNQGFQQAMQNYQGLQSNAINAGNGLVNAGVSGSNMAAQQALLPAQYNAINSGALSALGQYTPGQTQTMGGTGANYINQ